MFVRVKKNRSGSSSVLVVRKASGRYIVVKNLGVATDEKAIESLRKKGGDWIRLHTDPLPMQFGFDEREEARRVLNNIDFVYHDGARIILNQVYHLIGFDEIKDSILRDLVVARICEPASKRSTLEYLKDYFDEDYTLNKVYYYLDKLGSKQKNTVRRISVEHTRKILGGKIGLRRFGAHHRLLRLHLALLRDIQRGQTTRQGILQGRQDGRVADYPRPFGQRGRLSASLLHPPRRQA